ncbi:hypothetical protein LSTR_LSTR016569 [Laodelphax striatellus]|uniref:Uncharacterized protein n=1 Tax=Laodelphax striatellus TaxID=195883 RepID=A0A482XKN5_LAOST|nr:hypothetical protein LSTR_LSTR016569 [Laodelphax striatellus]
MEIYCQPCLAFATVYASFVCFFSVADDKLQVAADCTDQKPSKAEKDEEVGEEEEQEEEEREVEKEENTGAPPVTSAVALNRKFFTLRSISETINSFNC